MAKTKGTATARRAPCYESDQERWDAVASRDPSADGSFYFSVKTTGVYCRTTCPARMPLRKNVRFHESCDAAERAGFRPCKRCKPNEPNLATRHAQIVASVCRMIEEAEQLPSLDELASGVGVSSYHLHRLFKAQTGLTPKEYARALRDERVRKALAESRTVTGAIHGAGFNSSGRFYETSLQSLGMTPTALRAAGASEVIRFAVGPCWLGEILVAASAKGVCAILLGDDAEQLVKDLQDRFAAAELIGGDTDFERWVAQVVGFVQNPALGLDLPLDIRGTAFQQRVWKALQEIPIGTTVSYSDVAKRVGQPDGARAVARACAANGLAVAIPCHRVVRRDGSLSGYRWGIERKKQLLQNEQKLD